MFLFLIAIFYANKNIYTYNSPILPFLNGREHIIQLSLYIAVFLLINQYSESFSMEFITAYNSVFWIFLNLHNLFPFIGKT